MLPRETTSAMGARPTRRAIRAIAPRPRRRRALPAFFALFALVFLSTVASPALAWVEAHVAGDDVRLLLDRTGSARVEHRITLKVSGGPLRTFEIRGVDGDAAPDPDGYVVPLREAMGNSLASATPVMSELLPSDSRVREDGRPTPPTLRVRFDEEKGLKRGVYMLLIRYKTNLAGRGLISLDGSMGRVEWRGPIWDDGFDSARTTFELPSGPTPPRADDTAADPHDDSAPAPSMFLSTVRRGTERDEIELLRTYAAKGESITWAIRVDARALKTAPPPAPPKPGLFIPGAGADGLAPAGRPVLIFAAGIAIFLLYSMLVAFKVREVARHARAAGTEPRPLIPAPLFLRSAGAGLALVAGIALELTLKTGTAGAALVALATALAVHRTPRWTHVTQLRGRGRWLPVAEKEAFRPPPRKTGVYLDVSTREGKALLLLGLGALGGIVALVMRESPYHAYLVALDATPLLAIFCTGRLAELPPDPAAQPARLLGNVAARVKRLMRGGEEVRAIGRIRVPDDSPDADELRLGLVPKAALPGFVALEVGVVYAPGAGGAIELPEILLRVTAGSACEEAVEALARHGRSMRGRKPNERVIAFSPRLPTARMTAAIAAALARAVMIKAVPESPVNKGGKGGKSTKGSAPAATGQTPRKRAA